MSLDIHGVFELISEVEGSLGVLLLLLWLQNPKARALAWWAWARILRAFSVSVYLKYDSSAHVLIIDTANALLFVSYALTWCGAREFEGRKPLLVPFVTGTALWLITDRLSIFFGTVLAYSLLSAGLIAAFLWLAAYEFIRDRSEPLKLRWPAAFILLVNGSIFMIAAPWTGWLGTYHLFSGMALLSTWTLVGGICATFVLFAITKERAEFRPKINTLTGPITGMNRGDSSSYAAAR